MRPTLTFLPLLIVLLAQPARAEGWKAADASPAVADTHEMAASPRNTVTAGDLFGDDDPANAELSVLVQTRYGQTVAATDRSSERALAADSDGWVLNRAFLRTVAKPNHVVTAKLLLDFASLTQDDPVQTIKLAYAALQLHPRLELRAGLFKRPFSLLELLPIGEYEFGDNGPTDGLIKDVGFAGRDVGLQLAVAPLPRRKQMRLSLAAFQGGRSEATAAPDGLLAGRVEYSPGKRIHLGADVTWRRRETTKGYDYADGPQSDGWAWSADAILEIPNCDVRAEVMAGDRTDLRNRTNPEDGAPARQFMGAWILGLYRFPVHKSVVMPGVRIEWLDADVQRPAGDRLTLSGAVSFDFDPRLRLLVDLTRQWVAPETLPLGKKPSGDADSGTWRTVHDVDFTRLVLQLQVRL